MSLEYWFPLTSDLHNQGIASLANASVQSGCSLSSDGKLGGCYKNTGTTANVATPISFSADQFTMTAWVRIDARTNGWHRAVGMSGSGTYMGMVCENTNGTSVGFHYYKTIDGTNTSIFDTYPCSPTVGTWYHYAMCYDGTRYYVYLNGNKIIDEVAKKPNIRAEMTTLWLFGGTSNNYVKDSINDVRIYSHCLSPLEIAEIAKGMILHYPMTGGGRGQDNLVPNQAQFTSVNPKTLTTTATDGNSWLSGSAFEVTPSTTYTFSVCCDGQIATKHATDGSEPGTFSMWLYLCNDGTTKNWQGGAYDSPICFTSSNYNHKQVGNRHIWQYTTTSTQRYMSIRLNNYGPGTVTNHYWEFKIEKGSIFTPYIPNANESQYNAMGYNDNTEYDVSGYNNHGTINGGVSYSSDTVRYVTSTYTTNTGYIQGINRVPTSLPTDSLTVNIWVKPTTWGTPISCTEGGGWNFEETGSGLQFQFYVSGVGYKPAKCSVTGASLQDGKWHMLTGTYDRLSKQVKFYIDGILKATTDSGSTNGVGYANNFLILGGEASGSGPASTAYVGSLSDTRIYATALTATQVAELYNTSASISNNGTLMAYEFVEQ